MHQEKDHPAEPILSYAEPATYHSNSRKKLLKRRWSLVLVQASLVGAMALIGGNIGAQFFSFRPWYPWEATLNVRTLMDGMHQCPLQATDRDRVTTSQWNDQIAQRMNSQHGTAYTAADIAGRVRISPLRSGAFTITVKAEEKERCEAIEQACDDEFRSYNLTHRREIYPDSSTANLTTFASLLNPLIGVGMGLTSALAILWYAHFDFKRRAFIDTERAATTD